MSDGKAIFGNPRFFEPAGDILAGGDMVMVATRDGSRVLSVMLDDAGTRTVAAV